MSCNRQEDRINYLTNGNIKYWDVVSDVHNYSAYCYSFSIDGICKYYYYTKDSCKREIMYDGDVEYENSWNWVNDSTLRFRSSDRKVKLLNNDTLIVEFKSNRTLLVKSLCPN